ncbi:MAG: hypothetical protein KKE55_03005 [Candidatus Omnitrophica bacterium]|nr:hypothetical protein [Candidatus Omnitrophota bacterium]
MSIIYEALKKVENKEKNAPSIKSRENLFILIPLATGIICLLTLGFLYFKEDNPLFSTKLKKMGMNKKKNTSSGEKKYSPHHYILEGIVFDQETPSCIINGKVLREQDEISGLKVTNITPTSVELHNPGDNSKISLSL